MKFLAGYLQYLSKNFYYINIKENKITTSEEEMAMASLVSQSINNSIKEMITNESTRLVVVTKLLFNRLTLNKKSCLDYLVPLLKGNVYNKIKMKDNTRANKICSKPELTMKSYETVKQWIIPSITNTQDSWNYLVKLSEMTLVQSILITNF